ncbi:MAG TPA: RNA polymerase sigma factor [Saprospiraceae bacterium]|nr:RNA polymerase sigma factor [Saprospiraceae bacterium]
MTDEQLVEMLLDKARQEQGFRMLMHQYRERLYSVIRKIVLTHENADDVFQNTMIKIFTHIGQFGNKSSLFTWMYRIATNEALSFLRRQKKVGADGEVKPELTEMWLQSDPFFDGDELQIELMKAVALLPSKQKEVFNLRYFDEMKYSDLSELLGVSEGALKATYYHATKKIEAYFSQLNK